MHEAFKVGHGEAARDTTASAVKVLRPETTEPVVVTFRQDRRKCELHLSPAEARELGGKLLALAGPDAESHDA